MKIRIAISAAALAAAAGGCSSEKKADAAPPPKEGSVAPRPTVISVPAQPYRVIEFASGVTVSGTVEFDGEFPPDSVIIPPDQRGCGPSITDRLVERSGSRVAGAIVWLDDIRAGKSLPLERRFELRNEGCRLTPRVQAVVAPGTLNMASEDVAMHSNWIVNVGTGEREGIAPFNDNGEVVPFDRLLDRPKQLEITCELHPWSKAWILVMDHPYFTVSPAAGTFSIGNVPPGTYRLKAWHPELGLAEQVVTFTAGASPSVNLKLAGAAGAAPPPVRPETTSTAPVG